MTTEPILKNEGFCFCCDTEATFIAYKEWFRDYYICSHCGSIPRERALLYVMERFLPDWTSLRIHESSPSDRPSSKKIARGAREYLPTQYWPNFAAGEFRDGVRCENLEALTFPDEFLDLHITQDVMEHIFDPASAFKEIARTLRPGGMHIFTVPLVNKERPTFIAASLSADGTVAYHREPEYHANPVSEDGSLVTRDWGYDICDFILAKSGMTSTMVVVDALQFGIRAEYIEVIVSRKSRGAEEGTAL